jgi:magnesium-transporting ATPase (P-type)
MKRRPRPPSEPLISKYLLWRILLVSVLVSAAVLALFHASHSSRGDIVEARTVSVNVLVACELFYLFSTRFLQQSSLSLRAFLGNPQAIAAVGALIVLQLGFTYLGIANTLLGTSPLPAGQWIWISGAGLAVFLVVEAEKAVTARLSRESGPPRA